MLSKFNKINAQSAYLKGTNTAEKIERSKINEKVLACL